MPVSTLLDWKRAKACSRQMPPGPEDIEAPSAWNHVWYAYGMICLTLVRGEQLGCKLATEAT